MVNCHTYSNGMLEEFLYFATCYVFQHLTTIKTV